MSTQHSQPKGGLRVLILEDVPTDAELMEQELRSAGIDFLSKRVDNQDSFIEALHHFSPEIILSDYSLPGFDGKSAFSIAQEKAPWVPFVFVTGALGEDHAVDLLKSGATDFVLKDRLNRLPLCVKRALEEVEEKRRRQQAERKLRDAHAKLEQEVDERTRELRQRTFELQQLTESLDRRVQERTVELAKTSETLRHLSSKLLSSQEEERKIIAGEIHDTLGSCLSGIKFKVENILQQLGKDSNVTEESLSSVIPLIQEGIEECRRMQQDLRPSILDDLGLLPTLSWFCRRYQTIYTGIKVELEQTLEERDIPISLKIVIFRVTQEGMNNIAKHSRANLVHLCLRKMDGKIELVLEDNGQGFDPKKVLGSENMKRGLGLTSMRERTELSGGSFAIESAEGKGTTVRASWPFHENDRSTNA